MSVSSQTELQCQKRECGNTGLLITLKMTLMTNKYIDLYLSLSTSNLPDIISHDVF